jgi:hypothetical protein
MAEELKKHKYFTEVLAREPAGFRSTATLKDISNLLLEFSEFIKLCQLLEITHYDKLDQDSNCEPI